MRSHSLSMAGGAAIRSASPPSSTRSSPRLSGDEGARRIIARYPAFAVDLDDPGILVDIDTEDGLDALRRGFAEPPAAPSASAVTPL